MRGFRLYSLLGLLILALGACNSQTGTGPSTGNWTSTQFNQAWSQQTQNFTSISQNLQQDPAFQALSSAPSITPAPSILASTLAVDGSFVAALEGILKPLDVRALAITSLPRGGTNYTTQQPSPYTPSSPFDFGIKWLTSGGQTAELLVDWDKSGAQTVNATDPQGNVQELPQSASAVLTVGTTQAASADLSTSWYTCGSTPITEPTALSTTGSIGVNDTLSWNLSYQVQEGATDVLTSNFTLTTTSGNDSASVGWDARLEGTLTRGLDCFIKDFTPQNATLKFTSSSNVGGNQESFVFDITITNMVFDAAGNPTSIDVSGSIKVNGQTAVTFQGTLDDMSSTCPGAHVTLTFSNTTMTLQQWLQSQSYCTAGP